MGVYIQLTDYKNSGLKESEFFNDKNRYTSSTKDFSKIPGSPIAYWVSEKFRHIFKYDNIGSLAEVKQGLITANNDLFQRNWHEVSYHKITYNYKEVPKKWVPYRRGGEFRKWYGNNEHVVNWDKNGYEIRNIKDEKGKVRSRVQNENFYFLEAISWGFLSSTNFGVRWSPSGFLFDLHGSSMFPRQDKLYLTGVLCSKLVKHVLDCINPTMSFQVGDIQKIPVKLSISSQSLVDENVKENIDISKLEWDSRETSWDFKQNELIRLKTSEGSIKSSLEEYTKHWTTQFFQLHKNEEELNKIFIEIYGLQDELSPDVPLSDITILKDEIAERDEENKTIKFDELVLIKQFISYAVGCMVGRYSLDVEGLVYAGGDFDSSKYQTFKADKDGIIPILSDDRFEDDITSRFKEFVKLVFGEKNYSSNLEYIANILGRKDDETAIECIRRYFLNDFYKDHVKMYKKRPIYWLYSSGKEKGFNAIVYMHRYKKETISILRMDYLHKLQRSYDTDFETAEKQEKLTSDSKQKIQLQKNMIYLKAILQELKKYDELLRHYADKQVEIDLDDGVVVNYDKFKDLLVKI